MTCINCGSQVYEGQFCNQCGTRAGMPPPPPPQYGVYQRPMFGDYSIPSIKDYVIVMLLAAIPIAGIIMMIIWAAGGNDTPLWKSNYAKAYFIILAIGVGAGILFSILFGVVFATIGAAMF